MSSKVQQLEQDLEHQRRFRQYDLMAATAKKLLKGKGDSSGHLEAFVAAEIAAEKVLGDFAKERPAHFLLDSLGSVAERPKISSALVAELNPLITQAGKNQVANILQGSLLCEAGEYPEAIALLKDLTEPADPRLSSSYLRGLAARVKANYFNGKIDEAASTIEILDAFATKNATIVDEGNIRWIEEGLYLSPFIAFAKSSKESTLKACRSYLMKGVFSDPMKRISILRNTIALLNQYFTNENYPAIEVPSASAYKNSPLTLNGELVLLVALLDWTITNANMPIEANELKLIYDEICATLTPLGEYQMLLEILERSMKVYFGGDHFLLQYALVLISLERYEEAVVALNICMKEDEKAHYLASNILINHLGNFVEGFKIAERALTFENGSLKARLHQLVGLGYSRMAQRAWELSDKKLHQARAIDSLKKSLATDPQNPETLYLLALAYTEFLDIESAAKCAKSSLLLSPDQADVWHLLSLLKSCQYDFDGALKLCETGLQYDFADLGLWLTRTSLIEKRDGPAAALTSICDAFAAVRQSFLENTGAVDPKEGDRRVSSVITPTTPASDVLRRRPTMQAAIQGGASLRRKATLNKRPGLDLPHTQTSLDSNRSASPSPRISPSPSSDRLDSLTGISYKIISHQDEAYVALWTTAAELYTKLNKLTESTECLKEAYSFLPESAYLTNTSTLVHYQLGLLKEAENAHQEALQSYEKVLTVDENHAPALIRTAAVQIKLGEYELAETNLRSAVRLRPTSHEAWFHLGVVHEKTERLSKAAECFVTALELDNSNPIRPFSSLPRKLEVRELTFIKANNP